ncbi:hypothetical protein [Amorphus sp. 3PC139-8]|uniref:hypothetical protein n=1 Tax=Amorphus sp. 3PC139-8 TaxID=2735676 RepID=UPI00345C6B70
MKSATFLAACAAASLLASPTAAGNLTYGSGVPERSAANQFGVLPMLDTLSGVTAGKTTFTPFLGGQIVSLPGGLPGIRDHVVDAGFFLTQFHPSELPTASLMAELTGLGTDPYATIGALNEVFFAKCKTCASDMKAQGVVPLMVQSATPLTLQCTRTVESLDDVEGLRVAVIGQPEMRWISSVGGVPVQSSVVDLLSALQLGQADCGLLPVSWIKSYGLQDTVKSVIDLPQGIITGAVPLAFNAAAWASLAGTDRQAMIDAMPQIMWDYVTNAYVEPDQEARAALSQKLPFSDGGEALTAAWAMFQASEPGALKQLAEARGIDNADALVDEIVETFRVWHEDLLPKFKGDPDTFARIVKERVYGAFPY